MSYQFQQPAPTGPAPQGQPAPLHPTVSYGQPGGQQAVVYPPAGANYPAPQAGGYVAQGYSTDHLPPAPQPAGQAPPQPQPQGGPAPAGYQPAPVYGAPAPVGQPGYGYQPAGAPAGQPAGPQGQRVAYLDPEAILDGPTVPQELRGRKVGQAFQIYSALASDWLRREDVRRTGGAVPPGQQPPPQGQVAPPPQQYGQPAAPQGQPQRPAWAETIRDVVREVVASEVAPVRQQAQVASVQDAMNVAAQNIPDFRELEGDVRQLLATADPRTLGDPRVWESAADLARGKRGRTAYRQQGQPQAVQGPDGRMYTQMGNQWVALPQGMPQAQPQGYQNGQAAGPTYVQPRPAYQPGYGAQPANAYALPQYTFFAEGPQAPTMAGGSYGMLSPKERDYARKMNMSDEDYVAWRGGVIR